MRLSLGLRIAASVGLACALASAAAFAAAPVGSLAGDGLDAPQSEGPQPQAGATGLPDPADLTLLVAGFGAGALVRLRRKRNAIDA